MAVDRTELYKNLPDTPGVYLMYGAKRELLYIGKASVLKRRVSSYFLRPHDSRIESLISRIRRIGTKETGTALEALILESLLIKKHQPPFNIREKDDRSFLFVEITKDAFPRVLIVRGRAAAKSARGKLFGPFTTAGSLREALRILRRVFPYNLHSPEELERLAALPAKAGRRRACFDAQIGLCPGTCVGRADRVAYRKAIRNLALVLGGKTQAVLKSLEREMNGAAKRLEFEEAARIRRQVYALRHVRDVALIGEDEFLSGKRSLPYEPVRIEGPALLVPSGVEGNRIEGYDISNISGTSAVGSMVVFLDGEPDKREYRKFRIRTIEQSDSARPDGAGRSGGDTGMLREVLLRRFGHDWELPTLIMVDGGVGQVHTAERVVAEAGLTIPVVGIAKGPERKRNDVIGKIPKGIDERTLIRVRDEAHRFAVAYHRMLRSKNSLR
ncbi:MAG: UvrB/UvrC motif-containing protein [bacterium]|nr:UvrB/UvrC motif-containing protein [bacterium]